MAPLDKGIRNPVLTLEAYTTNPVLKVVIENARLIHLAVESCKRLFMEIEDGKAID
jgi:hypothetical protein